MKKHLLLPVLLTLAALASLCEARINVLEPWHPGLDLSAGALHSSALSPRFLWGERFLEIPVEYNYVTSQNIEVGGRLGVMSRAGKVGINDLMLGGKYLFFKETGQSPAVTGEAAVSLPTGNFSDGLGTGSVDLLIHWLAGKKFANLDGTFGLGMRFNSENSDKFSAGNVFFYHLGASQAYNPDLRIYCELKGATHGKGKYNTAEIDGSNYNELYFAPGADYKLDNKTTLNASLLIGMTSKSQDLGLLVSTKF